MFKTNTWRTILPEYQENKSVTPKKVAHHVTKSQIGELITDWGKKTESKSVMRGVKWNKESSGNPLVSKSPILAEKKPSWTPMKNRLSNDNPLNQNFVPSKSARLVKTKLTASQISCLASSKVDPEPPRKVKLKNSETHLDFLPGSTYKKTDPQSKSLIKIFNLKNITSVEEARPSVKKLKANKLANKFSINEQFR